jgi:archaellum component FlaG (FlaF/FlaG flagellin family)
MNLSHRSPVHILKGMAVATLLTLCLVFGASASQPGTILVDQVNLRNEPSTEASIVNWLNAGDTVTVEFDKSAAGSIIPAKSVRLG